MKNPLLAVAIGVGTVAIIGAAHANQIAGAVDANGHRQVQSPQYTVSHPSVGRYIIHFRTPFPAPYATCILMPIENLYVTGLTEKTTSCDFTFADQDGKLTNGLFNFLAVDTTD